MVPARPHHSRSIRHGTASSNPVPSSEESGANCASAVIDVAILHRNRDSKRLGERAGSIAATPKADKLLASGPKLGRATRTLQNEQAEMARPTNASGGTVCASADTDSAIRFLFPGRKGWGRIELH
jgi:hypothetical protein